jgi:multiple antibiotic resistance protein
VKSNFTGALMHTLNDILKFAITLLSIINPIGAIPVFLGFRRMKKNLDISRVSNVASTATVITILVSLFLGQTVLNFFGISISSFTIGGGILLFTISFSMLSAHKSESQINHEELERVDFEREIGVIPLAIPLLSGPGAISTCIIQAKGFTTTYHWIGAVVVVVCIGLLIKVLLTFAEGIGKRLGQIGINVMTRIMGLLLLATSIEMVASGVKEMLPILKATVSTLNI